MIPTSVLGEFNFAGTYTEGINYIIGKGLESLYVDAATVLMSYVGSLTGFSRVHKASIYSTWYTAQHADRIFLKFCKGLDMGGSCPECRSLWYEDIVEHDGWMYLGFPDPRAAQNYYGSFCGDSSWMRSCHLRPH